jgi:hypothetical protein
MFHIQSGGRFIATAITPTIQRLPANATPVTLTPPAEGSFFLLSNRQRNQSYVVRLTSSEMISEARQQIASPASLGHILIAEIGKNSGGFNRNLSESQKTPWSWHIEKPLRFADLASQDCDGSPEMLEELILPWIENSGLICFWNYQIIKELSADEVGR